MFIQDTKIYPKYEFFRFGLGHQGDPFVRVDVVDRDDLGVGDHVATDQNHPVAMHTHPRVRNPHVTEGQSEQENLPLTLGGNTDHVLSPLPCVHDWFSLVNKKKNEKVIFTCRPIALWTSPQDDHLSLVSCFLPSLSSLLTFVFLYTSPCAWPPSLLPDSLGCSTSPSCTWRRFSGIWRIGDICCRVSGRSHTG